MTSPDEIDHAAEILGGRAERNVALAPLTTYRVGGAAALMVRARTVDDLHAIAKAIAATGLSVLVVGRGSNMLIADSGFDGIAVTLHEMAGDYSVDGTQIVAGAALFLPQLARRLVAESLTGFEWAVGVPGSIGGAVRMNAGGHGSDIQASLVEVRLFDLLSQWTGWVSADRLGLRFRGSDLASHQIVVEARIQLREGDRQASQHDLDEIVHWRREHQPGGQNCGSVFVNPVPGEISAGQLIEQVGLRGYALGTASVSPKHANFIQSSEGGSSADVLTLIELVRQRVAAETGYVLRSEVRLVGFAEVPFEDEIGVAL